MSTETTDYENTWQSFWKEIVMGIDGQPDLEQIKKELYNYKILLKNVPIVYDSVTFGRISKPNTDPIYVIDAVENRIQDAYLEGYQEAREKYE